MIPALLLLLAAGALRAVHDTGTHAPEKLAKWGPFWDNRESWKLKYKNSDPAAGPRFPSSTTVFVGLTDGWHLSNLLCWLCVDIAFVWVAWPAHGWWALLPVVGRRAVFEPLYRLLRV